MDKIKKQYRSVEINGVLSIKKIPEISRNSRFIFVMPQSLQDLKKRLIDRGESEIDIENRLQAAKWEIEISKKNGLFDKFVITSNFNLSYENFKEAIFK